MPADQATLPQLLVVAVLSGLAIKYFFFTPPSSSPTTSGARNHDPYHGRIRDQDVDHILQMFPQVNRRDVMWDLLRNGGSVAGTTERVLGRGLEVPPPSFRPPMPPARAASPPRARAPAPRNSALPDLIARYHLEDKLADGGATAASSDHRVGGGVDGTPGREAQAWSQNRDERQALLRLRREEMILKARRRMEEQVRAERGETT